MNCFFDELNRFVIEEYAAQRPFSSFLPGIAGPRGIPMWALYVNRGQAIASFGVESKDAPVMEFQPANKAYQTTPYTGFRTFVKIQARGETRFYEPFSVLAPAASPDSPGERRQQMAIGSNELELQETSPEHGLQVRVVYFVLPGEPFAGLVRQVTLTNLGTEAVELEVLDGLPVVIPYGLNNWLLKELGRTVEAWMGVYNLEQGVPFYRLRASVADTAEVTETQAGFFSLGVSQPETVARLGPVVDPALVFEFNTALSYPEGFLKHPVRELVRRSQVTTGKTPCAMWAAAGRLAPGESMELATVVGYAAQAAVVNAQAPRLAAAEYLHAKRQEANALAEELTRVAATRTASPRFDAYCRQTFLDNVLRGGWPVLLGPAERPFVYHIYSHKHGDLERDYNAFYHAPEFYSQGNGNYRDVNQNRREDTWFNPRVDDFNIVSFMSLIQADGYNPLVIQGSRFRVPPARRQELFDLLANPQDVARLLEGTFTSGRLLTLAVEPAAGLRVAPEQFLTQALGVAEQEFVAVFGEGYWVDHWTYNLDLIESYLGLFPDRKAELLFGRPVYTFYDSPETVRPRAEKYVLVNDTPRQSNAVAEDAEKKALIAARESEPNRARTQQGRGEIYRTTLFAKLLCLAVVKFAGMDPGGMGIEMEAGKPGWYDALNGLPGLFGSSMPETYELLRLVDFMLVVLAELPAGSAAAALPVEVYDLLQAVLGHLKGYQAVSDAGRDFVYWDAVAGEREQYRGRVRLGFAGEQRSLAAGELVAALKVMREKVAAGLERALELNGGFPPTYLVYTAQEWELQTWLDGEPRRDGQGRSLIWVRRFTPRPLPVFLEGAVRYLKTAPGRQKAAEVHRQVRSGPLFDAKLGMYKINASLEGEPFAIGRARAFPPGWLENESIWLHMEYKYLLELLKSGLHAEFFADFGKILVPFLDPQTYGRSPLENSSFIASSAHPDESLHGAGFVARLSGSTAEFLSLWRIMLAGEQPFEVKDGSVSLALQPALPGWLFDESGQISFTFLGGCQVTYHNPARADVFPSSGPAPQGVRVQLAGGETVELEGGVIPAPYAEQVRAGQVRAIEVFLA